MKGRNVKCKTCGAKCFATHRYFAVGLAVQAKRDKTYTGSDFDYYYTLFKCPLCGRVSNIKNTNS